MNTAVASVQPYAKAVIAFITPGVTALVVASGDSSAGGSNITGPEWIGIFAACILTAGAVYATPNRDPKGEKQDESVQPPKAEGGEIPAYEPQGDAAQPGPLDGFDWEGDPRVVDADPKANPNQGP